MSLNNKRINFKSTFCILYLCFWLWANFSLWISISFFCLTGAWFRRDDICYLCHPCGWHLCTTIIYDHSKLPLCIYQYSCFLNILSISDILASNMSNIRFAHENCIPILNIPICDLLKNKQDRKCAHKASVRPVRILHVDCTLHRRSYHLIHCG